MWVKAQPRPLGRNMPYLVTVEYRIVPDAKSGRIIEESVYRMDSLLKAIRCTSVARIPRNISWGEISGTIFERDRGFEPRTRLG